MVLEQTQFYILLAANIPLYWLLGWFFFSTWRGFGECIMYWLKPDIASLIEGELGENFWAQMKIIWWLLTCGACIYGELQLIAKFLAE